MRARPGPLLAVSLLLTFVGCGGEKKDFAQAACDLHFSCDCSPENFTDEEACVADVNAQITKQDDDAKEFASANGLQFDQACADRFRAVPDDYSCDYVPPETNECVACATIHGDQPLAAGCTAKGIYSDCDGDLVCFNGLCLDPCQRLAAGDNCVGGTTLARCGDGLFCDADNTKQCQPAGGVGSPCPTGDGCNEATYCGDDKTCVAPPKADEPCGPAGQCAETLYCAPDTTCQPIPADGAPCDGVCQEHLVCTAGMCEPGPGVGEPCPMAGGDCGPGARCQGDTCVAEMAGVCELMPADMME